MKTTISPSSESSVSQLNSQTPTHNVSLCKRAISIILYGLGLSLIISFVQWAQTSQAKFFFIGMDGMQIPIVVGATMFCVISLSIIIFRFRIITVVTCSLFVWATGFGASQLVRIDGYYGNRTPKLVWRWTPESRPQSTVLPTSIRSSEASIRSPKIFEPSERDFPGLLGNHRTGEVKNVRLASNWNENPPTLLWRRPVGVGWSSFAVVGEVAIDLEQRGEFECVVCYDLRSGEEIWCNRESAFFQHEHGDGPRSTPSIINGSVVTLGATGVLTCLDLVTGDVRWKKSLFDVPSNQNLQFGTTCSPVLFDDRVFVTPGGGNGRSALCFDLRTGDEVWRSGDDHASYASPAVVKMCGENVLLNFNGDGLRGYSLDGTPIFFREWVTQGESRVNVAQPIVVSPLHECLDPKVPTRVVISSGYDRGTALVEIKKIKNEWTTDLIWTSKHLKSKLSNFVVYDNFAYGCDGGICASISLKDGSRAWKKGRYGHGQMLLVNDKILLQEEEGDIVLIKANPKGLEELARFPALESKTWNNLALAGNVLVVRNDREAAAYELPEE